MLAQVLDVTIYAPGELPVRRDLLLLPLIKLREWTALPYARPTIVGASRKYDVSSAVIVPDLCRFKRVRSL